MIDKYDQTPRCGAIVVTRQGEGEGVRKRIWGGVSVAVGVPLLSCSSLADRSVYC